MIIAFETKRSDVLDDFLDRYENPKSLSATISKNSFLEFSIIRINDLVIISQKHLFDVITKWLLMASVVDLLFAYWLGYQILFFIGGIFAFISIMWLSKYVRFFALKTNIKRKGHKEDIRYVEDLEVIEVLLERFKNGAK